MKATGLGLLVVLLVLGLVFGLVERLFRSRPGPGWFRREGTGTDLAYWFFTGLVTRPLSRLTVALAVGAAAVAGGRSWEELGASRAAGQLPSLALFGLERVVGALPFWPQLLLGLLLIDLIGYGTHRLFHRHPLWPFHAVHHSSRALDWLSASRLHPVNDAANRLAQGLPLLLLGFDPLVFASALPILSFHSVLLHANVSWTFGPLRYVIASPRFHRWHHTSQREGLDRNFAGLFPALDLLFGTFHLPPGEAPRHFGVEGERVPEGLLAQLTWPFRAALRGARR